MLFTSFDFLLFLLIVLPVQRLLSHRPRNYFLLLASMLFYGAWSWKFVPLMWITIITDFICGRLLGKTEDSAKRKLLLLTSCTINLSILFFFKYANFFLDSLGSILNAFGQSTPLAQLDIVLPVGISFYTFQSMSYTIDVYRKKMPAMQRLSDYALYVSIFPQLVAGPIERGDHLAQQILKKTIPSWEDMQEGAWLILKGLFKKTVIADNLATLVDPVFASDSYSGPAVLIAITAFSFQIYGDFAGYTDIARGVGRWMGYDFMLNFRHPYFALSPSDFWQRWHISLSTWLRDYLYIPLGGNRGSQWATCRNLLLTMVLGGLWHGAAWNFVVWGLFHGLILVAYRLLGPKTIPSIATPRWLVQLLLMWILTSIGWLVFRASSLEQITEMLTAIPTGWNAANLDGRSLWLLASLCIPLMLYQFFEEIYSDDSLHHKFSVLPRAALYTLLVIGIVTLGNFGGQEFIYFQF